MDGSRPANEVSDKEMSPVPTFPIMRAVGTGFECNICSKVLGSARAVKIHYNWKHAKDGRRSRSGSADVNLDSIAASAARERELDELIDQLIPEIEEEEEEEEVELNTSVTIKEEQDVKPRIVDVHTVKNEDELDPGFTCPLCRKQFASEKSLKQHTTWKHSESGPFTCPVCEEAFPSKATLNRHTKQKHTVKNEENDDTDPDDEEEDEFAFREEKLDSPGPQIKLQSTVSRRRTGNDVGNSLETQMPKRNQPNKESSRKGRNVSECQPVKSVSYNIAKKKLILKKMRAKAKQQAPLSSISMVNISLVYIFESFLNANYILYSIGL